MSDLIVFQCDTPKDHKCDDNGPQEFGLTNGEITSDKDRARKEGCSWGSVTCSICGMSLVERELLEAENVIRDHLSVTINVRGDE